MFSAVPETFQKGNHYFAVRGLLPVDLDWEAYGDLGLFVAQDAGNSALSDSRPSGAVRQAH